MLELRSHPSWQGKNLLFSLQRLQKFALDINYLCQLASIHNYPLIRIMETVSIASVRGNVKKGKQRTSTSDKLKHFSYIVILTNHQPPPPDKLQYHHYWLSLHLNSLKINNRKHIFFIFYLNTKLEMEKL